jgi:hypothetical protein
MPPWERRLRDLSQLLRNCSETYFEPDLFRQNTNQFLQTSRTVTFIIQKNKHDIREFDSWYKSHVLVPWGADAIMSWAKDARNVIEKEGDLDMHSELHTSLIFSHDEYRDMVLSTTRTELLKANLEKLVKHARAVLPPRIADDAVLRIERRWVANSLIKHELGQALTYAYSRVFEVCESLAHYLEVEIDASVPHPTTLYSQHKDSSGMRYIKLNKPGVGRITSIRIGRKIDYQAPPEIITLSNELKVEKNPISLAQTVERLGKMAQVTFEVNGSHVPMLFLFNDDLKQIDLISTVFYDKAEKFLFWRNVAKRAAYLRAYAMIFTSEVWIRDLKEEINPSIRQFPIIGEKLHVIGADINDGYDMISWNIIRDDKSAPTLELDDQKENYGGIENIHFIKPIIAAMKAVRT